MEWEFISVSLINMAIHLVYTILALIVSLFSLFIIDKKLMPGISLEEEMKKGNLAVAIFTSTVFIFVALIVTAGFKG